MPLLGSFKEKSVFQKFWSTKGMWAQIVGELCEELCRHDDLKIKCSKFIIYAHLPTLYRKYDLLLLFTIF
jgi:hypothetical protein